MFFCKLVMAAWRSQLRCACGCLLCFFIVIPNVVGAQSKEERLTLPSALSRVIERNPSLKVFNFRLMHSVAELFTVLSRPNILCRCRLSLNLGINVGHE